MDSGKETGYFLQSVRNLFALADKQSAPKFSDFLSEEQEAEAEPLARRLARETGMEILFWGGYEGAVRVMLGVFPDPYPAGPRAIPDHRRHRPRPQGRQAGAPGNYGHPPRRAAEAGDAGRPDPRGRGSLHFRRRTVEKALLTQFDRIGGIGVRMEKGDGRKSAGKTTLNRSGGTLASVRLDAAVGDAGRDRPGEGRGAHSGSGLSASGISKRRM